MILIPAIIGRISVVADSNRPEALTTAYDRDALEAEYGELPVYQDTFTVSRKKYERMQANADVDAIGGARVLVSLGGGKQTLLVSNHGEAGWDIPGGAREPGEVPEETARREVREEVGLSVDLGEVLQVFDWGFLPDSGDGTRVRGLWVHFTGVVGDSQVTVQDDELETARWFTSPPKLIDLPAAPIVRAFLHQ